MFIIKKTEMYESKRVFVDIQGHIVIEHGNESVSLDRKQAKSLIEGLQLYITTGNLLNFTNRQS